MRTSLKSPWQNAFAERFIGSIRRILMNHVIVFGEHHARSLIRDFIHFYNNFRPHQGLGGQSPLGRTVSNRDSPNSRLRSHPVLNGLSHFYDWEKDAA
ncbi:integrase core domain-containing protein [Leptospira neocaledonica]|uniref:integrase core domain-containing protein n=1 Tax=Leptospira neocaledonica TaxID=2023192 RepID=UPI003CC53197